MRSLLIHNIKSGFGSDALFEFERALLRAGDEVVLRTLPEVGGAAELTRDAEDFDLVVVSGGDGTVANLLYELKGKNCKVCVFPSGTANLYFETLGNSTEPFTIAHACHVGATVACDMAKMTWVDTEGHAHEHGFSLMAGTGFDAQIMASAVPHKQSLGEAAYFTAALSNIMPDVHTFSITIDGVNYVRKGIACIFANNAMLQGEIEIIPNCSMTDGLLDLIVLEVPDAVHLIKPVIASLIDRKGTDLGRPHIERFSGKSIQVEVDSPIPMQVDGEVIEGLVNCYQAEIIPAANKIIVDPTSRYYSEAR